jgi:transcriptional antiterminator/mannitol/fructose-specific phosphotransferase system IIA component (Ntr-type)
MVELDSRARDLLLTLLRSSRPLSLESLGGQHHVSVRQVRYALEKGEPWLEQHAVQLHSDAQGRRWFDLADEERVKLIRRLEQCVGLTYLPSAEERVQYALLQVLIAEEPVLVKQLRSTLNVSRTTVRRDLDEVSAWLEARDLTLWSRPHVGTHFRGSEKAYREALIELLIELLGLDKLLAVLRRQGFHRPDEGGTPLEQAAWSYVADLDLELAARQVGDDPLCLELADVELVDVFLYLAIAIRRACTGHFVRMSEESVACVRQHWAFRIAERWFRDASAAHHGLSELPKDELAALAVRLAGARWAYFSDDVDPGKKAIIHGRVSAAVNAIVDLASQRLHPYLRIDPLLARGLTLHLVPALERIRFERTVGSSLSREICRAYPEVFSVARECGTLVENVTGLQLPDGEIGFLAMHLGAAVERLRARPRRRVLVVCGEGIASAWLLVSRLRALFPFVEVVDVVSARELLARNLRQLQLDMVISTVRLSQLPVPLLVVSPLLGDQDVRRVGLALDMEPVGRPRQPDGESEQAGPCLVELVKSIWLGATATGWEQATEQAGRLLVQQGIAEPQYVDAMISLLHRHGPYMVVAPGIALLHALPQDGALEQGMALLRLRAPVSFGHESNDPVDIIFAFACTDGRSHLLSLDQLTRLLDDAAAVRAMREARTTREIYDLLLRFSLPAG